MMPVVRISDASFADLKSIAKWFEIKTPSQTIDRIVRETMEQLGMERDDEQEDEAATPSGGATRFDAAPALAFTKPVTASINGKALHRPHWATILLTMIRQVKAKGLEKEKLADELLTPAKLGKYEDEGFRYYPDLGISVQGRSSSDTWMEVDRLAKKWRIPVTVEFRWLQNPRAQYPGKTGTLQSGTA